MKVSVLGPFSQQFILILLPWPSMASMVAWTSIESIGWIPWKWSPIAPWIPQKLSEKYMETVEYIESIEN